MPDHRLAGARAYRRRLTDEEDRVSYPGRLTAYRKVLHERIHEATGELSCRYRANPTCALISVPEG